MTIIISSSSPAWVIGFFTAIFVGIYCLIKAIFKKNNKNDFYETNPYNFSENDLNALKRQDGSKEYMIAFLEMILKDEKLPYDKDIQSDFGKFYNAYKEKYGSDEILEQKKEKYFELVKQK